MSKLNELATLIREAKCCHVFTGAGVSTLSGIRDFRGKDGVYAKPWEGHRVEEILSLPFFRKKPELFYAWAKEFCYRLEAFDANIVHRTLAKMQKNSLIADIYTQNIDLLHQKAGSPRVYEIHGSPSSHHCSKCKKIFYYDEIAPKVMRDELPRCDECSAVIKPDIILYGESLDAKMLEQAFNAMADCDLLLVLGSSLTVQPAASMPLVAYQNGAKVVIVNAQPTPIDFVATILLQDLDECFTFLDKEF
ncbi:MAG: NAD-dependent deacylase [Bradymonadales bacterium]